MGMWDEFDCPRERKEMYPTIRAYADSRTLDQLAILMCVETYQRNVFGTYSGAVGEQSREILASVQERAKREAYEDAAKLLDEGYDREVEKYYRKDRLPSKNDECPHGWYVYEDCESCAAAAIRAKAEGMGE